MDDKTSNTLQSLLTLITEGKITELEAERLLNAATRLETGVPTGQLNKDN